MGKKRRKLVANEAANETMVIVSAGSVLSGRYELVKELGRGGMGIVYEAKDKELHDKQVAIKVLPPEMSTSKAAIKRLKKEAIAAMELTHENVMRLHSFETDENTAYLVLEYIDGEPLDERLADEERLSYDETLEVLRGAVAGLSAAHRQGIIHRDIKPANLMYKTVGDEKVIRITDFGIAYVVEDSMTRLTGTESAGTLSYIAPEQLKGTRANAKTDQYSLAAAAYELLSGEPPFVGAGLSHQILHAEPHLIDDIPDCANEALMRALAKDPDERFEDLNAFFEAFAGNTVIETLVAPTEEVAEEIEEPQKGGIPTAGIVLIFLLLIGALGTGAFFLDGGGKAKVEVPSYAPDKKIGKRKVNGNKVTLKSVPSDLKVYDDNGQYLGRTPLRIKRPRRRHTLTYVVDSDLKIKSHLPIKLDGTGTLMLNVPNYLISKAKEQELKGKMKAAAKTMVSAAQSFSDDSKVMGAFYKFAAKHPQKLEDLGYVWLANNFRGQELELVEELASSGVVSAQLALGRAYEEGKGLKQSYTEAVTWYQKAADGGSADGQYRLASCYEKGNGVEKNFPKAKYWYQKALQSGHSKARKQLSILSDLTTQNKRTIQPDKKFDRLLARAQSGDNRAQLMVGVAYLTGTNGKMVDKKEAQYWLTKAARNGNSRARTLLRQHFVRRRRPMGGKRPKAPQNLRIGK